MAFWQQKRERKMLASTCLYSLYAWLYLVINVGTSSQFTFLMPEGFVPSADSIDKSSPVEYVPFFDGRYLSETASLNGGNVLAAFVNMLLDWFGEFGLYRVKRGNSGTQVIPAPPVI